MATHQQISITTQSSDLIQSYQYCNDIIKSSSFYSGISFTEKTKRDAIFAIYTWQHVLDDIADNSAVDIETRAKQLNLFQEKTFKILSDPSFLATVPPEEKYWLAFRETIHKYNIPHDLLALAVAGQQQDLIQYDYKTFAELYAYCQKVASSVGKILIILWGYQGDNDHIMQKAEWCGIAFQLTNILRDVYEDKTQCRRVYLPAEFFGKDRLTADDLMNLTSEEFLSGTEKLMQKTEKYYQDSLSLYKDIDADGKLSFLVIDYAYRTLFNKIHRHPKEILTHERIHINFFEKLLIIVTAMANHGLLHRG